ncbi:hypothetical protein Tco_0441512 [Tanacetum coccineum]
MTFINANVLSNFVSLQCLSSLLNALLQNTMAEQNVPAQPPTRTDEQIISVDILSNTNFFQGSLPTSKLPAIYLQQFGRQCIYQKTGVYSCQLDEQWFDLSVDLLRKALAITPVNPTHPFELPPSGDTVIDFVNELGYPEPVEIVSMTNPEHTVSGKCCGNRPLKLIVLMQADIGIVLLKGSQTFFLTQSKPQISLRSPKTNTLIVVLKLAFNTGDDYVLGNLKFVPKGESVEVFGMAIPDPLITEAIQQSSYYPKYLEMVAENTKKTPQESASVQPATKRATPKKHTTTTPVKQSKPAPPPTKKPSKHKLPQKVRKGKPTFQLVDEDDEAQQESIPHEEGNDPDLERAKKMSLEALQEKGEGEGDDADLERAIKLSLDPAFLPQGRAPVGGVTIREPVSETTSKLHEVVGKGKAIVTEEQVAHSLIDLSKKKRTTDQFILVRRDQTPHDSTTGPSSQPDDDTTEKVIHESSSTSDSERTESETETAAPKGDKDQGEVDSSTVTSGVSIPVSDPEKAHEALAGPDPEPMKEDQTGSDSGKLHVSLAGPNPEHMDDEFLATAYPKVHENLKLITDERVIDDKPESHSGSMSSMKNLDDTFNFGDQFLYDKPTEDDQEKSKVREESDSTIPDSSHQTVTSTPPVIAPFTDVSSSKPSLLVTPPPINTEATTITTSPLKSTPIIDLRGSTRVRSTRERRSDSAILDLIRIRTSEQICRGHSNAVEVNDSDISSFVGLRGNTESDISAVMDHSHWWFRRKEFYIHKHSESSDSAAVRIAAAKFQCDQFLSRKAQPCPDRPDQSSQAGHHVWIRKPGAQESSDFTFKEDYTDVMGRAVDRVMEKLDHLVKDFICSSTIGQGGLGSGHEDDKRRSIDLITANRGKVYRSEGSMKSRKKALWRKK